MLDAVPMLAQLVRRRRAHSIELRGKVRIEVTTASTRTTRGYSFALVVADELSFWRSETSSEPDVEVLDAVRPGMATLPGSRLIAISSPHGKWGALYDAFRRHYGRDGDVLVWKAPSADMNPSLDAATVAQAYERDPQVARSEYGAEFRDDVAQFLDRERVEALVIPGRVSLPARVDRTYVAAVDMSGGASDSAAVAVAHREPDGRVLVDCVVERPSPHDPEKVAREFCGIVKRYRVSAVTGDAYAAGWCSGAFLSQGVSYLPSERNKSEIYAALVPLVMTDAVELPDDKVLVTQLCGLERRVVRGSNRETIDHRPGARDDVANATALCCVVAGVGVDSGPVALDEQKPTPLEMMFRDLLDVDDITGRGFV
jgi:hypothetical protein